MLPEFSCPTVMRGMATLLSVNESLTISLLREERYRLRYPHGVRRYRFSDFIVSPRRRVVVRQGRELSLIPRYFDLLVFLIERRHEAVHRRDIFDRVWSDVIVSDSALTQAIRTLRRTLGDNSREPRFIRTVSRHGYQFVCERVVEEWDDLPVPAPVPASPAERDEIGPLLDRLIETSSRQDGLQDARDAAERLLALGTDEVVARLRARAHPPAAVAVLREARWTVAGAGDVPLEPRAALALIRLRILDAGRIVASHWATA